MKKFQVVTWQADDGQRLLELRSEKRWYIPLSEVGEKELRELAEAIQDALSHPVVSAIRSAEKEDR